MQTNTQTRRWQWLAALVAIVGLAAVLHLKYINEFPAYIHAWAQSDWYALSVGFVDNGMDFFHPQTLIYNKQFPDNWGSSSATTITSVDFPLHCYLAAFWMRLLGTTAPWVFRGWTLLISILGMCCLFRLSLLLSGDWIKALLVTGVAMTSPVYAYYFGGFIPGIPALACAIAGLWLYFEYVFNNKRWAFHLGVVLMGTAVLMRTTFAIPFIAALGYEFLRICRHESTLWDKLPSVAAMALIYLGWHFWNAHLRAENGSLFLNELRPAKSIAEAKAVYWDIRGRWMYQYFTRMQHLLVAGLSLLGLLAALLGHYRRRLPQWLDNMLPAPREKGTLSPWWFVAIYCIGVGMFVAAMTLQLRDHDYYFVDSLLLPILIMFALLLRPLPNPRKVVALVPVLAVLVCLLWPMANTAKYTMRERRNNDDRAYLTAKHYRGSDQLLDSAGIGRDAKIVALFAYPQNTPFILMGRKGYTVMWYDPPIIENALHSDFDYIAIEKERYQKEWKDYSHILSHLVPVAGNDDISICKWSDTAVNEEITIDANL